MRDDRVFLIADIAGALIGASCFGCLWTVADLAYPPWPLDASLFLGFLGTLLGAALVVYVDTQNHAVRQRRGDEPM